jgi:flagellar biosynthesis protein FliP
MTTINASTAISSGTSQIRRRKSISSSYLTLCVILALSFVSLLVSLLSFNGIRTTLTILNRGVTTTTIPSEHSSLTNIDNNVFVAEGRNDAISDDSTQQSAVNSTNNNNRFKNNSATNDDDDGMIEINTIEYDNELRRMVEERKKDGAQRGKIAWLMRYVRFLQQS